MFLRLTSSAFALTLAAAPALALTPEEVWTSWTTYYGAMGYTVAEGSRDLAGETLTVKDVVFTHDSEGGKVAITMPQIVLQGAGDGGVRTTVPDPMAMRLDVKDEDGKPVGIDITMTAPGMEIVSTGEATKRTDKTTAPSMEVTVDKVDMPDDQPDLTKPATLTVTDFAGETVTEEGKSYTSSGRAAKLAYAIDMTADGSTIKGEGTLEGLEGKGNVILPASGKLDLNGDLGKSLNDGAAFDGTMKFGANTAKFDYSGKKAEGETPAESTGSIAGSGTGGEVSFRMSKDGIGYQGAATGFEAQLTDSNIPVPVSYKMDNASFDLQAPVSKSDTPQPFKLAYSLGGVTIGDQIWDMVDPGKKLPRDPASLDLDLTGQTKVSADLFSLAQAAAAKAEGETAEAPKPDAAPADPTAESPAEEPKDAAENPFPFDPIAVTVNQFALSAVGAKVSANGELKAPEGKTLETPVGTLHAKLEGVNALIDTLVSMGLVPQDQVQGYRMMLAMFTKTVEGKDEMTSDIEFKEDGSVLANGQQIK